jgi:hypothetical protein
LSLPINIFGFEFQSHGIIDFKLARRGECGCRNIRQPTSVAVGDVQQLGGIFNFLNGQSEKRKFIMEAFSKWGRLVMNHSVIEQAEQRMSKLLLDLGREMGNMLHLASA